MSAAWTNKDLLRIWERTSQCAPARRAEIFLQYSDLGIDAASSPVTVGMANAALARLLKACVGERLSAVMACDSCQSKFDLELPLDNVLELANEAPPESFSFACGEFEISMRHLDLSDLAAAGRCKELSEAEELLFRKSVTQARRNGETVEITNLPGEIRLKASEHLAASDPLADLRFEFSCPDCASSSEAAIVLEDFLWAYTESRAHLLLLEVAELARRYAWREADILAMSDMRRRTYLEIGGSR